MNSIITYTKPILYFFMYWLLIFSFQRILFFSYHFNEIPKNTGLLSCLMVFLYSFRLDLSTIAFLAPLYIIIKSIQISYSTRWLNILLKSLVYTYVFLVSFIHSGEVIAYYEWGHKLTSRVFMHLAMPDEVVRTADGSSIFHFTLLLLIELSVAFLLLRKVKSIIDSPSHEKPTTLFPYLKSIATIFVGLPICLILARGGVQQIPINIDAAYFSKHQILNDVSVNSCYFFGNSFVLYNKSDASEHLPKITPQAAQLEINRLFAFDREHENNFISATRPNIVIIILEGWSANAMGSINPCKTATPNFDNLAKEGVLFTKTDATNTTSEIGNTSIFAGYPSVPETAISLYPEKHRKLPTINEKLQKKGYSTHYLFSGDLKYGNIKGFLMEHHFDELEDESDFPKGLKRGKLNYYDQDLYALLFKKISVTKPPFLHCAFTGSTHSPYDYPLLKKKTFSGEEDNYLNSMVYADKCLGDFIAKSKKTSWYKNTIFVVVSDHGHASPGINSPFETAFFNIPMLIFGEPIINEYRGKKINKIGSQADLAATLLHQLHMDSEEFLYSKDLMSPNAQEFAFYSTIRGYGYINPLGNIRYNFDAKKFISSDELTKQGKFSTRKESEACFYAFFKHFEHLDAK